MEKHATGKRRACICILLIALSLLLLGAGRIKQDLQQAANNKITENEKWMDIISRMTDDLPAEHRAQWKKLAAEKPQLFLKVSSASISRSAE